MKRRHDIRMTVYPPGAPFGWCWVCRSHGTAGYLPDKAAVEKEANFIGSATACDALLALERRA
jgi:hypothetical protein